MPWRALLLAASAVVSLAPQPAASQTSSGWFGTWTLNLAKSVYSPGPPPYRRATYTIEPRGEGWKVTYDMVHPRGGVTHLEWVGTLDGRDYAVQGMDDVITYAYVPVRERVYDVHVKFDGRLTATSRVELADDGSSITTTTSGTDSTGRRVTTVVVYDRR